MTSDFQCLVTTHVIAGMPCRSEKFLFGCASGLWMLHESYLNACEQAGKWVDESLHEWYLLPFHSYF